MNELTELVVRHPRRALASERFAVTEAGRASPTTVGLHAAGSSVFTERNSLDK